jgi:cellulose 1,4-beta-cellobiosidase
MYRTAALVSTLAAAAYAQQAGTLTTETHPSLPMQSCSAGGSCTTLSTKIVLDSNWRWLHSTSGSTNCYTGNTWNAALCPDGVTCAANCALDGADYTGVYGITTSGNSLKLGFVTKGANINVGSRVYLIDTDSTYKIFKLKNMEFTFDVDVSNMPCGLNGAVYFVEMDADGGMANILLTRLALSMELVTVIPNVLMTSSLSTVWYGISYAFKTLYLLAFYRLTQSAGMLQPLM